MFGCSISNTSFLNDSGSKSVSNVRKTPFSSAKDNVEVKFEINSFLNFLFCIDDESTRGISKISISNLLQFSIK